MHNNFHNEMLLTLAINQTREYPFSDTSLPDCMRGFMISMPFIKLFLNHNDQRITQPVVCNWFVFFCIFFQHISPNYFYFFFGFPHYTLQVEIWFLKGNAGKIFINSSLLLGSLSNRDFEHPKGSILVEVIVK